MLNYHKMRKCLSPKHSLTFASHQQYIRTIINGMTYWRTESKADLRSEHNTYNKHINRTLVSLL